jgi:hypothetical protein
MKIRVETTSSTLTNHAGLFHIGRFFKTSDFGKEINAVSTVRDRKGVPSDRDIVFCMIALYALGKPTYEAIEEYRYDRYFREVLGVRRVPSEETLRQRIEQLSEKIMQVVRRWNREIIAAGFADVAAQSTTKEEWSEAVTIGEQHYMIIDSDVSVLDNSNSKKEGVSWTYKKCDGYAPMFSYIGKSGYMLNNELREGSAHSNCAGTTEYVSDTIALGKAISENPLLMVLDSGNDSKTLLQEMLYAEDVFFVIKRNLRTESVQEWLETAKANPEHEREARDGSQVYYKTIDRALTYDEVSETVNIVVVARERLHDAQGQMLLAPEISVETYWTNLSVDATEVEHIYHQHGTSEQYHGELKSDLGVERLPSGKFHANTLHLLFSMVAFNLLRRVGTQLLLTKKSPGKRGRRLRLRTVLHCAMYLAGMVVSHAGQMILRVCEHNAWTPAFLASL